MSTAPATTSPPRSPAGAGPVAFVRNRAKAWVREMIPAHRRFVRDGRLFLAGGEREVHELADLVAAGSVAVDVGAHRGGYTHALCRHVGPQGRVIAVEPNPNLARILTVATRRLQLPVTVVPCALSDSAGEADLHVPVNNGRVADGWATLVRKVDGAKALRVPLRRLDDVLAEAGVGASATLSFIKIDVEGHELAVLRGAAVTLSRHRPNLLIEIEQRHSPVPIGQTFAHLLGLAYRGFFFDGERRRPLDEFDVETHQTSRLDRIGTPAYVCNFTFRPA